MVAGGGDRLALHRARQADAERLHRELQWAAAGRTAEQDAVPSLGHARDALADWKYDYNTVIVRGLSERFAVKPPPSLPVTLRRPLRVITAP